jgi:hypothetical protein
MATICSAINAMSTNLHLLSSKRRHPKEAIGMLVKNVKHHALRNIVKIIKKK